jgi:hypothetical protein
MLIAAQMFQCNACPKVTITVSFGTFSESWETDRDRPILPRGYSIPSGEMYSVTVEGLSEQRHDISFVSVPEANACPKVSYNSCTGVMGNEIRNGMTIVMRNIR